MNTETTQIKLPQPGETFRAKGRNWVALGYEQGGLLAISTRPIYNAVAFDEDARNDWRVSSLRKRLNGEILDKLGKDGLLPFTSDLTADDGMTDYDTCEDYVFLLSCDLYRKYRRFIPRYDDWLWTLTPWTCNPSLCSIVRFVSPSGSLSNNIADYAVGAVAGLLFNLQSFEVGE